MFVILLEDLYGSDFTEMNFDEFFGHIHLERLPLSQTRHVQRCSKDKIYCCRMASVVFLLHYLNVTVE